MTFLDQWSNKGDIVCRKDKHILYLSLPYLSVFYKQLIPILTNITIPYTWLSIIYKVDTTQRIPKVYEKYFCRLTWDNKRQKLHLRKANCDIHRKRNVAVNQRSVLPSSRLNVWEKVVMLQPFCWILLFFCLFVYNISR